MVLENDERKLLNLDKVLVEEVGACGWFQFRVMALCALVAMLSGISVNHYIFTFSQVKSRCVIPECESNSSKIEFRPPWILDAVPAVENSFDNCHRFKTIPVSAHSCSANVFDQNLTIECKEYVYEHKNSAVYEFNLACDDWRPNMVSSVSSFGTMLALPIGGFVADKWGRRVALALSAFNLAWIGSSLYFSNSYICYLLSSFARTLFGASCADNAYILAVEYVGSKHRVAVTSILNSFTVLGRIITGVIISTEPYWRNFILITQSPLLITVLYFWIAPESIRWLISKSRHEEAVVILKRAAEINGNVLSEETLRNFRDAKHIESREQIKIEPWIISLVFKHKPILLRCLLTPIWWITTIFIFCGLTISSVTISGNRSANYCLVSAVAIPGYWIAKMLLDRIGRRSLLMTAFWICGVCQFVYVVLPKGNYRLSLSMYLFSKMCTSVCMTTISVFTAELYPTQYRASLYAFSSTVGTLGSLLAPVILSLAAQTWNHLPYAVYGTMAFISGFLVFLAPETLGSTLPDTMEEAANLGKGQKKTETSPSKVLEPLMSL